MRLFIMIEKIFKILSDFIEYIKNYQMLKAGRDSFEKEILENNNEIDKKIESISKTVNNYDTDTVERMLHIKISDK